MSAVEPSPDDLARELAADQRLGDRRDWTLLGTGGFGSVFRVDHDDLGRREAVKVLRRALDPKGIEEFRREARHMGSIGPHPYLLTVFDAGVLESGRPYVVAEYVPGGSLQQRLVDGGALAWSDAVTLGCKVAAGLQRCHDAGVLHLDIKPANILIDADSQPRLADFGVARSRLGSGVTTGAPEDSALIATTMAYSPPELLEGKVSEATDVYMLAATVHALCCGHPPFPRPRDLTEFGVPPAVAAVIDGALDPDPERRPASAADLGAALTAAAAAPPPEPVRDSEVADTTDHRTSSRRAPTAVLGVAVVAVLALVIGGWMLRNQSPATSSIGTVVTVTLEPVTAPGEDPFVTELVAATDLRAPSPPELEKQPAAGDAGTVSGTEPGLYGGSNNAQVCDTEALAGYLAQTPEKAAAFAGVLNIEPADIPSYLQGLAPVVVQFDTWVTNHGYRDSKPIARQSVLQAGTAVLVDDLGVPRVRCSCGNPLGAPKPPGGQANLAQLVDRGTVELAGTPWPGFTPPAVLTVTPGADPVDQLDVIDLDTGEPYTETVGPSPEFPSTIQFPDVAESACPAGPVPTAAGASDGARWSVGVTDQLSVGNGRWLTVLSCQFLRNGSNQMVVALVFADGSVTDWQDGGGGSGESPFHVFEDESVWLAGSGYWPGSMADGPRTVFERNFRVEGDSVVKGEVVVEYLRAGDSDLMSLRVACGALEDARRFSPLAEALSAGSFVRVGVDPSGTPFAVVVDSDGSTSYQRTEQGWSEASQPPTELEIATAASGGFPGGPLGDDELGCYSDDTQQAYTS